MSSSASNEKIRTTSTHRRALERAVKARGTFAVIVGPDGVGKTTLAKEILRLWPGPKGYFHFLPTRRHPIIPAPQEISRIRPKPPRSGNRPLGWLRMIRNLIRFWWAYLTQIRPLVRSGALVIGDRWCYGYTGQPYSLRFYGPEGLARIFQHLFPSPDLLIDLKAPVDVIASRKSELTRDEIGEEMVRWSQVEAGRRIELFATEEPRAVAEETVRFLRSLVSEY